MGVFRFKQFSVNDEGSAMKVGTDAVLLGAWCPVEGAKRILDIGTGSGVIALMLAQRSGPGSLIDAVELREGDARQARENVQHSPWPEKINVVHERIQNFQAAPYDLIVCNPPFFSQSLLPPDPHRAQVRHDHELPRTDLLRAVLRLLDPGGRLCLVVPTTEADAFGKEAAQLGFHLHRHTRFHTRVSKPAERSLLSFALVHGPFQTDDLVLYEDADRPSAAYLDLTGAFYL